MPFCQQLLQECVRHFYIRITIQLNTINEQTAKSQSAFNVPNLVHIHLYNIDERYRNGEW